MMKRIGGRIGASFHLGMSGLSAYVAVCVQLMCESGMTLIGLGGVTSSVRIRTQTLWYGGNFYDNRNPIREWMENGKAFLT
jgi:hypothetical protein